MLVAALIIVGAVLECLKLSRVGEEDQKYITKHVIANHFLNTCQGQMRVLLSLKETIRDYQTEINRLADSGDPTIKARINQLADNHKAMKTSLQKNTAALATLVAAKSDIVPDSYRIDFGYVQTITSGLLSIIDRITVTDPHQYVSLDGLPLATYDEFVRLQIPLETMLSTYNVEKYANYNSHLRKDEIFSQHLLTVLSAVIALFFNMVTLLQIWTKRDAQSTDRRSLSESAPNASTENPASPSPRRKGK
jgi:hypothetical protein